MISRTVTVGAASGLHARPAARFAQAVADKGVEVELSGKGGAADAQSALELMALGIGHGEEATLTTDDDSAGTAMDELAALLASDLDA